MHVHAHTLHARTHAHLLLQPRHTHTCRQLKTSSASHPFVRRLDAAEKAFDAAATSPYARPVQRWVFVGMGNGARYQNYPRRGNDGFREQYFGTNLPRLMTIKRRYDPHDLFAYEQGLLHGEKTP